MTSACARCTTANEDGRKFCKECGAPLAASCPVCGASNSPDSKYCGECGSRLPSVGAGDSAEATNATDDPGTADRGRRATERRLVSVLFVDLVGFTRFAEDRDAEDVRDVLDRYYEAAAQAVQRHGGIVEKFIGDAVMAVWGTPAAHEDDAERAVRAALEVADQVTALGRELDLDLQARAAVATGEAAADITAVAQGMVTGDIVNTASRLQSAAQPGSVLVGEGTYRAASRAIAFEPMDPLSLKGKAEPVPAWRAVRVVGERGGTGRGEAPEPPFVGRDEELRLVKDLLHTTGREGRSRLLAVSGVAGVGKSRVVWELQKYVDGLTEDVYWHEGRCPAYGDGVSFWAFGEMVRTRAGIAETDDPETTRALLAASLADLVPGADERAWLEPRLGHLLGLSAAPPGDREELFGAWRRYVEHVAARGTTVLVFEDLQWADPGLLDFVESLLLWSRALPLLVVTLARPELADRRPTWGAGLRSSTVLHLDPLPETDVAAMVGGYLRGLPPDGLTRIVTRAEGIPLYAVETVRMLADRGVLEQVAGGYRVVGSLEGELDMPETLHALVAARLDGLDERDRSLLQDAAVLGQTFTVAALGAVSGRPPDELDARLQSLVRRELLLQDRDPRSPERGHFGFVQSVLREVAYATLAKPARRALHQAAAQYFASLADEELAGVVATHYLEAYRAEPAAAQGEAVAASAREWLGRASARALSLGSPELALAYAEQALSLATDEDLPQLLRHAALAATTSGDLHRAVDLVAEAVRALRAEGDEAGAALLLVEVAGTFFGTSNGPLVESLVRSADERLRDTDGPVRARVTAMVSHLAFYSGRRDEALQRSEEALVLAERFRDEAALRDAVGARAEALMYAGRHFESALLASARLDLARRAGSATQQAQAAMALGVIVAEDDPRASLDAFRESVDVSRRLGLRLYELLGHSNLAETAVDLGEWAEADEALAAGAEIRSEQGGPADEGMVLSAALLAAYRGDTDAVEQLLAGVDIPDAALAGLPMRTWFLRTTSSVRYAAGDDAGAYDDARESLELDPSGVNAPTSIWAGVQAASMLRDAARLQSILDVAGAHQGRWVALVRQTGAGVVAALDGSDHGESVTAALDAWTAAGLFFDHALATLCATAALGSDQVPRRQLDAARSTLAALGAVALLRRLDTLTTA